MSCFPFVAHDWLTIPSHVACSSQACCQVSSIFLDSLEASSLCLEGPRPSVNTSSGIARSARARTVVWLGWKQGTQAVP